MRNRIKDAIKEKGITQKELAEMIGVSEVGLSKGVNGNISESLLSKISHAINIPVSELRVEEDVLKAEFGSDKTPLRLGNLELPCYVLENGMRVFSGRGIQSAIGAKQTSGSWINRFINSKAIQMNLVTGTLEKLNNPIPFKRNNAGGSQSVTYGYEATLLIDLCNAIIDAGNDRHFEIEEEYVKNATIIIRAVAKVGIIALVDEATGYDKEKGRAKDELQRFLKTFVSQEAARWAKTFDESFFEMLYKLHNWSWSKTHKHPGVVGYWINDVVYERLGPMVLTELKKVNPKNDNGNRKGKLHQYLTTEIGHPKLKEHLASVQTLAKACNYNLPKFMQLLETALPKQYQQMSLLFPDED
jgi:transcriptional regulator with XRE-family HTH domain